MSNDTTTLITTHTSPNYGITSGSSPNGEEKVEEEDKCRNTTKILAFSTFLIALSVGGYFTADLLANKGESVKLIEPSSSITSNKQNKLIYDIDEHGVDYISPSLTADIRANGFYYQQPYEFDNGMNGNNGDFSMMRVTNCEQPHDLSDDEETYQTDIRAVANYLKTYWNSYASSIANDVQTLSNGDQLDPSCIQQKFEEGEVVCKDVTCIYDGNCYWKTSWDAVNICKYYYFDIGQLKHQQRADRRACIASLLVEQWSESCWEHDHISDDMKTATFKWWKQIFTVSDDWELDDCPC